MQEQRSGTDTLLKLYLAMDADRKALRAHLHAKHLPRAPRGGPPTLRAAAVLTLLVWGAGRGLGDKAKGYSHIQAYHRQEFPAPGAYSKCVEASNRDSVGLRALLALSLHRHRHAQGAYPIVVPDSTAIAVCHIARARQPRTLRAWARKAKNGMGWWYGFKLHVQCDEAGRLCGFDLTTATVDDRKLLAPLTRWRTEGIVVGDGGSRSPATARERAQRGGYLLTTTRKTMRHLASQCQLACWQLRPRVEELFEFLNCAFGAVRPTPRAAHALPIHLLCSLLADPLYKSLIA